MKIYCRIFTTYTLFEGKVAARHQILNPNFIQFSGIYRPSDWTDNLWIIVRLPCDQRLPTQ